MITLVTIVHIIVSLGLIVIVLLQTGKGADIGAVFGGSSSTIFGSSGAGNFLTRLTTGLALVFMLTSLTLGYFSGKKPSGSIFDSRQPPQQAAPASPAAPVPAAPGAPAEPAPQKSPAS
ncbi:MAG: preprotein translocase subunit SecG [Candidatus Binatia bacterium]